jgi:predicted DNA-binding protein
MPEDEGRPARPRSTPVMMRLPDDLHERLVLLARRRAIPPATLARQLVKERLDELNGRGG